MTEFSIDKTSGDAGKFDLAAFVVSQPVLAQVGCGVFIHLSKVAGRPPIIVKPLAVDVDHFEALVGLHRSKIFGLIREAELDVIRHGGNTLISYASIEKFLARFTVPGRF